MTMRPLHPSTESTSSPQAAPKGFTMLELLFVIIIMAIIGGSVAALSRNAITLNGVLQDDLTGQTELRNTVKDFIPLVRSIGPSATGAYALATVATSTFMFYSDVDLDGNRERVRYFLSGATLKKGTIVPSGVPLSYNVANEKISDIVHNVSTNVGAIFEYFDKNYNGTGSPLTQPANVLNVRLVKINLTVDRDPKRAPGPISITAESSMRNLKDNL